MSNISPEDTGKQQSKKGEWKEKSAAWCRNAGLTLGSKAWSSKSGKHLAGCPSARARDCINVGYAFHTKRATSTREAEAMAEDLLCDVSQNVDRKPWACKFGTFTTSCEYYSYGLDRMIFEEEKFALLGFDVRKLNLHGISAGSLRDVAGEAMAVPCVAMVIYSILLNVEFPGLWSKGRK